MDNVPEINHDKYMDSIVRRGRCRWSSEVVLLVLILLTLDEQQFGAEQTPSRGPQLWALVRDKSPRQQKTRVIKAVLCMACSSRCDMLCFLWDPALGCGMFRVNSVVVEDRGVRKE